MAENPVGETTSVGHALAARRALASEQVAWLGLGADCPPADQGSEQERDERALWRASPARERICDGRHAEAWGHCARTLPATNGTSQHAVRRSIHPATGFPEAAARKRLACSTMSA
jgi:hypothetical protein